MRRKSFFVSALAVVRAAVLFSGSAAPVTGGSSIAAMPAGPRHAGNNADEPTPVTNGAPRADLITGTVSGLTGCVVADVA